jgi:UDP-2,3-diacylglucosamine pyrophosphatase LpxH
LGKPKLSFSKKIKANVKRAVKFISDFEKIVVNLAAEQSFDYVICGHIHLPQIHTYHIKKRKIVYMNSGDWVENLSALEYFDNKWKIFEYDEPIPKKHNKKNKINGDKIPLIRIPRLKKNRQKTF